MDKRQLLRDTELKETLIKCNNLNVYECLSFKTEVKNVFVKWNLRDALLERSSSAFVSTEDKNL